jgi:pyruvate/2-oxoglutarate/acetoin dehydrogenase E1 component
MEGKEFLIQGYVNLTIMGQGIGLAMRGLRPIAEIQYLDYLLYGLQPAE